MWKISYRRLVVVGLVLAALTICASLPALLALYRVEKSNRAAGIALEAELVKALAFASGMTLPEGLEYLKERGLTGVTISETRLEDLLRLGGEIPPESRWWTRAFAEALFDESAPGPYEDWMRREPYASMSIGLDRSLLAAVEDAGLVPIARIANPIGVNDEYIDLALVGAAFLPTGTETLGYREELDDLAATIVERDMRFLDPEFANIVGVGTVALQIPERTIRLHSIQAAESSRMSRAEIKERFVRAFEERNIRWLMLRPGQSDGEMPIEDAGELVASVRDGVRAAGGDVKRPRPFDDPAVPEIWQAAPFLVAIFGLGLLGVMLAPEARWAIVATAVVAMVVPLALGLDWAAALLVALGAPVAGLWIAMRAERPSPLGSLLGCSLGSLAGGLAVAAIMSDLVHLIRLEQFRGVKLAIIAPVLVVGFLIVRERFDTRAVWSAHVRWLDAALVGLCLVAAAMLLVRTGNDSPTAVSGLELQVRALLDEWFYARPRTKEWLIGHPSLVVGAWLLGRPRYVGWGALLFVIGAIGQTSIVNTMTHLHSPLELGLARVVTGVVIGGLLGLVGIAALRIAGVGAKT